MKTQEQIEKNERIDNLKPMPGAPADMGMYYGTVLLPDARWCTLVMARSESGCWEHVSVAPINTKTMPSWKDMCVLKSIFWNDDDEVIQIHPKKAEYVNIKDNCLHLWKHSQIDSILSYAEKYGRGTK